MRLHRIGRAPVGSYGPPGSGQVPGGLRENVVGTTAAASIAWLTFATRCDAVGDAFGTTS
jgi:hypothetical protein